MSNEVEVEMIMVEDEEFQVTLHYLFITPCYLILFLYTLIRCYQNELGLFYTRVNSIPQGFKEIQRKFHDDSYDYMKYSVTHINRIKMSVLWCLISR